MDLSWIKNLTHSLDNKYKYLTPIAINQDSDYLVEVKSLFDNIEKDLLDFEAPEAFIDIIQDYKKIR